jgi:Domain of unknown function (DUF1816)
MSSVNSNRIVVLTYKKIAKGCDSCTVVRDPAVKTLDSLVKDEELGWWIEIFTAQPPCIYYFGFFEDTKTAAEALSGFTEDLLNEGMTGLAARIHFHSPHELTVDLDREGALPNRMTHFPPGVDIL